MTEPEKDPLDQMADDLEQAGKEINSIARSAVKEVESAYDDLDKEYNLKDRWVGAAVGGKLGALAGIAGGPFAFKTAVIGAVVGFVKGEKGLAKYREWRDENDDSPKSPNDGP